MKFKEKVEKGSEEVFIFQELHFNSDSAEVLWTCPLLEIPRGWVLLHGPQGVGKSSLLKVLSGTWPGGGVVTESARACRYYLR